MWIYVPDCEPCRSVQEAAGLKRASSWPFPALERCAGLSGKLSVRQSWYRAWKRDSWLRHLCGVISEPSTASHGVERWISSLRATHASHLAKRVQGAVRTILDTCGPTFIELSRRYVLPLSFWKTSQGTLDLGLEPSSEISNLQATELRRLSSQRRKWAQAINGNGCLSLAAWRTPCSQGSTKTDESLGQVDLDGQVSNWPTPDGGMSNEDKTGKVGGAGGGEFAKQANQWATPRGMDRAPSNVEMENGDPKHRLECQVQLWPNPRAEDSESAGRRHGRDVDDTLMAKSRSWASSTARVVKGGGPTTERKDGKSRLDMLDYQTEQWVAPSAWPTATAGDANASRNKTSDRQPDSDHHDGTTLTDACRSFPPVPTKLSDGPKSSQSGQNSRQQWSTPQSMDSANIPNGNKAERQKKGGCRNLSQDVAKGKKRLNPMFVRWLMGWPLTEPLDGTGFEPWGMESCPCKLPTASVCLYHASQTSRNRSEAVPPVRCELHEKAPPATELVEDGPLLLNGLCSTIEKAEDGELQAVRDGVPSLQSGETDAAPVLLPPVRQSGEQEARQRDQEPIPANEKQGQEGVGTPPCDGTGDRPTLGINGIRPPRRREQTEQRSRQSSDHQPSETRPTSPSQIPVDQDVHHLRNGVHATQNQAETPEDVPCSEMRECCNPTRQKWVAYRRVMRSAYLQLVCSHERDH